jgi:hypothetical protein
MSANSVSVLVILATAVTLASSPTFQTTGQPRKAVPKDPVEIILDAVRSRPLVALSEGQHWNEQGHRFRLALIRDPRFAASFNDIVVEFGNARYQSVMDRFVAGEDVPDDALRLVWENTTQPNEVWDIPIYEEFFRSVRALNASLPPPRRLRVVLADPPIDWDVVKDKDDILQWMGKRDSFAAETIRTQVLDRHRRALLIFGDGHLWRKNGRAQCRLAPGAECARPGIRDRNPNNRQPAGDSK